MCARARTVMQTCFLILFWTLIHIWYFLLFCLQSKNLVVYFDRSGDSSKWRIEYSESNNMSGKPLLQASFLRKQANGKAFFGKTLNICYSLNLLRSWRKILKCSTGKKEQYRVAKSLRRASYSIVIFEIVHNIYAWSMLAQVLYHKVCTTSIHYIHHILCYVIFRRNIPSRLADQEIGGYRCNTGWWQHR